LFVKNVTDSAVLQTLQDDLTGAAFHPLDDNLLITHGKGHLTFWTRRKDGFFERTDIIKAVRSLSRMTFTLRSYFNFNLGCVHPVACMRHVRDFRLCNAIL
jgi:hypothetical protein